MPTGIYKRTDKHLQAMSAIGKKFGSKNGFKKGHGLLGDNPTSKGKNWKLSKETKQKMSLSKTGSKNPAFGKESHLKGKPNGKSGELSHFWIKDRTKLKKSERKLSNYAYTYWTKEIKKRDLWKCRLLNSDCKGQLESHHIFNWVDYPELRYILTNGITLCAFHHPRGRDKEKRMIPIFQELLSVSEL